MKLSEKLPLVSICIPTYRRPQLLKEAIDSVLQQSYNNIEILVGDDPDDYDAIHINSQLTSKPKIRYFKNSPSLGQANNINYLFDQAQGEFILLLHDDDLLLDKSIDRMADILIANSDVVAVFGKQQIITAEGELLIDASEKLNNNYQRISFLAGKQVSSFWSALMAQFPNDGFLIRSCVARSVRYSASPQVGDSCDFDFGLRLASFGEKFYFLDEYTCQYRLTGQSVSSQNNYTHLTFRLIQNLQIPADLEEIREKCLKKFAVSAVTRYLELTDQMSAKEIYLSKYYPLKKRFSVKGIIHVISLVIPAKTVRFIFDVRRLIKNKALMT